LDRIIEVLKYSVNDDYTSVLDKQKHKEKVQEEWAEQVMRKLNQEVKS
jgi:hypothetical protein